MEPSRVRRRMLRNLLTGPWIVFPGVVGTISLALAAAFGSATGFFGMAGMAGIAVTLAAVVGQWALNHDELARQARADLRGDDARRHFTYLRQLQHRVRGGRDPRIGRFVLDLRQIQQRLERAETLAPAEGDDSLAEVRRQIDELYRSCLESLERSLELSLAAEEMAGPDARRRTLEAREQLLGEIETSLRHLGAALDQLLAALVRGNQRQPILAGLREELDLGLEVARRVESRMGDLERDLKDLEAPRAVAAGAPPEVRATFGRALADKAGQLRQHLTGLRTLIAQVERKKAELQRQSEETARLQTLREGAAAAARARVEQLGPEAARSDSEYLKCQASFVDFSSTLAEKESRCDELERDVETLEGLIAGHRGQVDALRREYDELRREAAATAEDLITAQEQRQLDELAARPAVDATAKDLEALRAMRDRARASLRVARDLAGADPPERQFREYAPEPSAHDEFERLVGIAKQ